MNAMEAIQPIYEHALKNDDANLKALCEKLISEANMDNKIKLIGKTRISAAKAIIDILAKSGRVDIAGAINLSDGRQFIMSGYHAVLLSKDDAIDILPKSQSSSVDPLQYFPKEYDYAPEQDIAAFSIRNLQDALSIAKASKMLRSKIGGFCFNPEYALQLYKVAGREPVAVYGTPNTRKPIFFDFGNGTKAILLPIREK